jgi:hypothetical protein
MEHSAEVQDYMRDKFTRGELYLFMQQETAAQFRQVYDLAMKTAREVQHAFWYERGDVQHDFLAEPMWDNLHEGLMAGERIELALRRIERAYMELNRREYELTKHLSLRLQFPVAFWQLKALGYCEIEIPEWMFDLDYPGHYMRRVKTVTLSIACVAGPYTGVHCRLQQLSSQIRIRPLVRGREAGCCVDKGKDESDLHHDDPYVVTRHGSTRTIATSSGQDDAGLFAVSFQDERYLPFEFSGAVSRWRVELPPENNQFDLDTLTDFVMHLSYTAREGGPELRAFLQHQARVPGGVARVPDGPEEARGRRAPRPRFPATIHPRHVSLRDGAARSLDQPAAPLYPSCPTLSWCAPARLLCPSPHSCVHRETSTTPRSARSRAWRATIIPTCSTAR